MKPLVINRRCAQMSNPATPLPRPGPIPGLPANHTPLRLMAPRVLVVEDEITVALLIEDMVNELAYEVAGTVARLDDAMRLVDSDVRPRHAGRASGRQNGFSLRRRTGGARNSVPVRHCLWRAGHSGRI